MITLFTGTALAQAIPLLLSPVLARLYAPGEFGLLALYLGMVSIISVAAGGRYEAAILLPRMNAHAVHVAVLSGVLMLVTFVVCALACSVFVPYFSANMIYYSLPFAVVFVALYGLFDRYNNRHRNYKLMAIQRLLKTVVEGIVAIALGAALHIEAGLVVGAICGYLLSSLVMLFVFVRSARSDLRSISQRKVWVLARKYINFPKYNMPHALLNSFSINAPFFLIPFFFSEAVVGFYAFGLRIIQAPLTVLAASVSNVLAQEMADAHAHGKSLNAIFRDQIVNILVLSLPLLPALLLAPPIFAFTFGEEWRLAGEYVRILTPYLILNFIAAPFAIVPQIFNRQETAFRIELIFSATKILSIVIGGVFQSTTLFLLLFSATTSIVILLNLIWIRRLTAMS